MKYFFIVLGFTLGVAAQEKPKYFCPVNDQACIAKQKKCNEKRIPLCNAKNEYGESVKTCPPGFGILGPDSLALYCEACDPKFVDLCLSFVPGAGWLQSICPEGYEIVQCLPGDICPHPKHVTCKPKSKAKS